MTDSTDLDAILRQAYENYGLTDDVGMAYFNRFKPLLSKYDFVRILERVMMQYPNRYVLDFLLSSSWLWERQSPRSWVQILENDVTRIDSSKNNDQIGNFADIEFMTRYVGVDALAFVIDSPNIPPRTQKIIVNHFSKSPYGLIPSELDEEDLDGEYFTKRELLATLKEGLIAQFGFKPFKYTEENANSYIKIIRENSKLFDK